MAALVLPGQYASWQHGLVEAFIPEQTLGSYTVAGGMLKSMSINGPAVTITGNQHLYKRLGRPFNYPLTIVVVHRQIVASASRVMASVGAGTNRHLLYLSSSGNVTMYSGSSGGGVQAVGLGTAAGSINFSVGRVAASNYRDVFVNGTFSAPNTGNIVTGPQNTFAIGAYWNNDAAATNFYSDEEVLFAGLWNRALSNAEILDLHKSWEWIKRPARSRIWVPVSAGGSTAYSLTLAAGSYTLTGQAATLTPTFHRSLALAAGAYSLIGQTVDLIYAPGSGAYGLTLDAGQYTLAGQALATRVERHLTTATGVFALAGGAVGLTVARHLAASAGTYAITGQDIALTFVGATHYGLTLDVGAYTVQGQDIVLRGPTTEVAYRGAYAPDMPRRKREKVDHVIDDVVAALEAQNAPERVVRRAKNVVHRVARVRQVETLAELDVVIDLAKVEDAVTRTIHTAVKKAKAARRRKQDEELLLVL